MAGRPRRKVAAGAASGYKLPEPIPEDFKVTDTAKKTWIIGKVLGSGGFGTVYFAAAAASPRTLDYVIKIEYHDNGPLFAEMHCYQNIGKASQLSEYTKSRKLDYLGLSPCHGFGSFEHNKSKYRFMVIERYGKDLQKMLEKNGNKFSLRTAYQVGISVLNILEYIHSAGYVHGDVKAANLLLGFKKGTENQVYLIDMGLACKYITTDKGHKKDEPNPKKAHDGTIEFASRDAHVGKFSRRGDIEILCFNLLQWLSGTLPWLNSKTPEEVAELKNKHMSNIPQFLKTLFPSGDCPAGLRELLTYVCQLKFEQEPDYDRCRKLLDNAIRRIGGSGKSPLVFKSASKPVTPKPSPVVQVSNKENARTTRSTPVKRKEKDGIYLAPGIIPTPAMLDVLRKSASTIPKTRKKN